MLDLKRIMPGQYSVSAEGVSITISNPYRMLKDGSNAWQLWIEVNGEVVVNEWFDTKKQANKFGTNWVINN